MASMDLKTAMILLFQIVIGILGNVSLIIHCAFLRFCGCRSRVTDLILRTLAAANLLVILSIGIPKTMLAFGSKHFLNDVGCNLVLYLQRVARGVSICATCLLSVFQTITISPMNSRWAMFKLKALKYLGPSNILCWILHMLVNAIFPIYNSCNWGNNTIIKKNVLESCSTIEHNNAIILFYAALISSHDILCLGFMSWASGSMVFILYRHKQRVHHLRVNSISPRASVATRATRNIVVLVSIFVSFYTLSYMTFIYLALLDNPSGWIANVSAFISVCFPTVSPFVLMSSDSRVFRLCAFCYRKNTGTSFLSFIRKMQFI